MCNNFRHLFTAHLPCCEWELLNHRNFDCEYMNDINESTWIEMNRNKWIFVVKNKTQITIVCDHNSMQKWLVGEGILEIQPNCIIQNNYFHLMATNDIRMSNEIIIPEIEYENLSQLTIANFSHTIHTIETHSNNISELIGMINELKIKTQSHDNHNVHHYIAFYSLLTLLFGFVSMRAYFYCKTRANSVELITGDEPRISHAISMPQLNNRN